MEITVRMQMPYDIDLISLFYNENFDLSKQMKKTLIAWAREDKGFEIETPEYQHFNGLKLKWFHFTLDDEKHKDVIEKWKSIREGYRNSLLKHLFRFYMSKPYMEAFQRRIEDDEAKIEKAKDRDQKAKENDKEKAKDKIIKEITMYPIVELPYPIHKSATKSMTPIETADPEEPPKVEKPKTTEAPKYEMTFKEPEPESEDDADETAAFFDSISF